MNGTNIVILVGTVGKDPEVTTLTKKAGGEIKKATFSFATNKKRGENTDTQWHNIEVWGPVAEITEKYVTKGKALFLRGELRHEKYEKDGVTKTFTKIVVEELNFLPGGKNDGGSKESVTAAASPTKKAEKEVADYTKTEESFSIESDDDLPF